MKEAAILINAPLFMLKFDPLILTQLFKIVKNFSVKSGAIDEETASVHVRSDFCSF